MLKTKDVIPGEVYDTYTPEERRYQVKWANACEMAGIRKYPSTCSGVIATVEKHFDEEILDKMTARQIAEVLKLAHGAFQDGRAYERNGARDE